MIDGTCRRIYRPIRNQAVYYNGMIRAHCIKFLAVVLPCGVIAYLSGPFAGIRHDSRMFRQSLQPVLNEPRFLDANGRPLFILADSGELTLNLSRRFCV
jgi:hypothetical protein